MYFGATENRKGGGFSQMINVVISSVKVQQTRKQNSVARISFTEACKLTPTTSTTPLPGWEKVFELINQIINKTGPTRIKSNHGNLPTASK